MRSRDSPRQWLGILTLAFFAWTGTAHAETFLILSLVGDRLTVVGAERQVGSNLDRNRQQVVTLNDQSLDDFAVRVSDAVIRKARPSATITMLRASDPALYSLRDTWLEADSINTQALLAVVAKLAPPSPDSRLLLIAPHRDELDLQTDRKHLSTGSKIAGMGFYVDQQTSLRRSDTFETGRGFLGLFANFQLVLINVQANVIEAHENVAVGTTFAASQAADKSPWNAISAEQKIRVFQSLMKREIERALPGMLSSASAKP
jgi:hypothetical protein